MENRGQRLHLKAINPGWGRGTAEKAALSAFGEVMLVDNLSDYFYMFAGTSTLLNS